MRLGKLAHIFIILEVCTASASCRNITRFGNSDSDNKEIVSDQQRPSDESEGVPGYYLFCSYIKRPSTEEPKAELGCKFVNQNTQQKLDLPAVATSWRWDYKLPEGAATQVTVAEQEPSAEWQAIYSFAGGTADEVWSAAQGTLLVIPIVLKDAGKTVTVQTAVAKAEQPNGGTGNEKAPQ